MKRKQPPSVVKRVNLELSDGLLRRVDGARGDVPRNRWIRRAIERELDRARPVTRTEPFHRDIKHIAR